MRILCKISLAVLQQSSRSIRGGIWSGLVAGFSRPRRVIEWDVRGKIDFQYDALLCRTLISWLRCVGEDSLHRGARSGSSLPAIGSHQLDGHRLGHGAGRLTPICNTKRLDTTTWWKTDAWTLHQLSVLVFSPLVLRARQLKSLKDYHWMPYNGAFSRDFSLPILFPLLLPSIGAVSFSRRFEMHLERWKFVYVAGRRCIIIKGLAFQQPVEAKCTTTTTPPMDEENLSSPTLVAAIETAGWQL